MFGLFTRFGAILSTILSLQMFIGLSTTDWYWTYGMIVLLGLFLTTVPAGRPYEQIEKTTLDVVHITRDGRDGSKTPAQAIEYFRELAAIGIDQAIFSMPNVYDLDVFDLLATDVIPQVSQIPVAGR